MLMEHAVAGDLRDTILAELDLSQRIIRSHFEVVPRFTIFAPDGAHTATVELPDDPAERNKRLLAVRSYMILKAAHSFVLADEIIEPDAISVIAVTRSDVVGALQLIHRKPFRFEAPEWFGRDNVSDEVLALLPPRHLTVTLEELDLMRQAFETQNVAGITWLRNGEED
jgi:hypothetical protein